MPEKSDIVLYHLLYIHLLEDSVHEVLIDVEIHKRHRRPCLVKASYMQCTHLTELC
jgi:hypothetical protein